MGHDAWFALHLVLLQIAPLTATSSARSCAKVLCTYREQRCSVLQRDVRVNAKEDRMTIKQACLMACRTLTMPQTTDYV
jgi:hypothetical protein